MSGPIAEAFVIIRARIDPNISREINTEVDAAMKDAERTSDRAFTRIDATIKKTGVEAKSTFRSIDRSAALAFEHMSVEGRRAAEKIQAEIDRLRLESAKAIELDVHADTSKARKEIAALDANLKTLLRAVHVPVELDTKAAEAHLVEFKAKAKAAVDKDTTKTFGELNFSLAQMASGLVGLLAGIAPLGPALLGVAAAAVAVVGAVGLASGALLAAGAAAASLGLAFAAVKVGSLGVADALKAQAAAQAELAATGKISEATQKKLDAALKGLSPSARALVKTLGQMSKAWSGVRRQVQEALFKHTAADVKALDRSFRPLVTKTLVGVADLLNKATTATVRYLTSNDGVRTVAHLLDGLRLTLKALLPGIGIIGRSLLELFSASVGPADTLAKSFTALATRFGAFADRITQDGSFTGFLNRALGAAGALLRVVGNLGKVLGGVFGAGAEKGVGLLDGLANSLGRLSDKIHSVAGQKALAQFFANISATGSALTGIFAALAPVAKGVGDVLASMADTVEALRNTGAVAAAFKAIGSALSALAPVLGPLLAGFLAFKAVAIVLGPVISAVSGLVSIIGPVVGALGTLVDVVGAVVAGFAGGEGLVTLIAALGGPVTLIAVGVAALAAGFVLLYKHSSQVRDVIDKVGSTIKGNVLPVVHQLRDTFQKDLLPALTDLWASFSKNVLPVLEKVGLVVLKFDAFLFRLWLTIAGKVVPVLISLYGKYLTGVIKALTVAFDIVGKVAGAFGAVVKFVVAAVKAFGKIPAATKAIGKGLANLPGLLKDAFLTLGPKIISAVGRLTVFVAKAYGRLMVDLAKIVGKGLVDVLQFFIELPFQVLAAVLRLAFLVLQGFIAIFTKVIPAVAKGTLAVVKFFIDLPGKVLSAVTTLGPKLVAWIVSALQAVGAAERTGIEKIIGFFTALPGRIVSALGSLGSKIGGVFAKAFSSSTSFVRDKIGDIVAVFASLPGKVSALGSKMFTAGKSIIGKLFDGLKSFGSIAGTVAKKLLNGIISPINSGIRAINNAIPNKIGIGPASINLPDNPFPTITPFAKGGIVDKATLALIGEAGREAVIPLQRGTAQALKLLDASGLSRLVEQRLTSSLIGVTRGAAPSPAAAAFFGNPAPGSSTSTRSSTTTNTRTATKQVTNHISQQFVLPSADPEVFVNQAAARLAAAMNR